MSTKLYATFLVIPMPDGIYQYQTLVDNVSLPEQLGKVNQLIVERGHTVVGKKPGEPLRGRCDSFVSRNQWSLSHRR